MSLRDKERALKIFALDSNTLLAYAGVDPDKAHRLIGRLLAAGKLGSAKAIAEHTHRNLGAEGIELIVAKSGKIACIKHGNVCTDCEAANIGDMKALCSFHRNFHAFDNEKDFCGLVEAGESQAAPQTVSML